jgi:hypothetical protein
MLKIKEKYRLPRQPVLFFLFLFRFCNMEKLSQEEPNQPGTLDNDDFHHADLPVMFQE